MKGVIKYTSFWLAILLALYVYASVNRYQGFHAPDGASFVLDRWTGQFRYAVPGAPR